MKRTSFLLPSFIVLLFCMVSCDLPMEHKTVWFFLHNTTDKEVRVYSNHQDLPFNLVLQPNDYCRIGPANQSDIVEKAVEEPEYSYLYWESYPIYIEFQSNTYMVDYRPGCFSLVTAYRPATTEENKLLKLKPMYLVYKIFDVTEDFILEQTKVE